MRNSLQRAFGNLSFGIILIVVLLTACSKDLFYLPASPQEEMEKAVEGGFDGMIVYVNQSGKSSFYSAGLNNREKQTLADPHSLFKIASISKLYMAAACSKLVANKKLVLDANLSDLLPEVEGETFDDYMSFMARVYDKEAKFKPNKRYGYSNSNYLLLYSNQSGLGIYRLLFLTSTSPACRAFGRQVAKPRRSASNGSSTFCALLKSTIAAR